MLYLAVDYRPAARANETVFRNVLRDLKQHAAERYGGKIIPPDFDTEMSLEEFYEKYSAGEREGKFTVSHCMIEPGEVFFAFELCKNRRDRGAQLHYVIEGTDVRYTGPATIPIGCDQDDDDC